jgi:hypothetical protein
MGISNEVKELLRYLNRNPALRNQIRAGHDRTLLYAGHFFKPIWKEIEEDRRALGLTHSKVILPDVLARIRLSNSPYPTFKEWLINLDKIQPWDKNGYIAWRALSGIFASNASGKVSFLIGGGVSKSDNKVFAATEIHVLDRNTKIDIVTKDAIQYYLRCMKSGRAEINTGLIHG